MKKTNPSELNPARNEHHRKWSQLHRETILIILVSICCVITTVSYFRAEAARDDAKESLAIAATWKVMYKETERECRLAQLEIDDFKIIMIRAGFDVHDGESP